MMTDKDSRTPADKEQRRLERQQRRLAEGKPVRVRPVAEAATAAPVDAPRNVPAPAPEPGDPAALLRPRRAKDAPRPVKAPRPKPARPKPPRPAAPARQRKGNRAAADVAQDEMLRLGPVDTARGLDFIVAGTARSGTTAVVQYLQAVDHIHCGNEIFPHDLDHRTLHPPHCFFEREVAAVANPNLAFRPKYRKGNKLIAAKTEAIRVWGNKTPRYIYRLNGVLSEIARPRAVVCTRSLQAVATSYARRALTPDDKFLEGRTGLYAVGDYIALCQSLAMAPGQQVMVVPHRALVTDWRRAMDDVVGFVSTQRSHSYDETAIAAIQDGYAKRKVKSTTAEAEFPPYEQAIVDDIIAAGIEPLLDGDRPFLLSTVQDRLRAAVANLPPLVAYVEAKAKGHPLRASRDYFVPWSRAVTGFAKRYENFAARGPAGGADAPVS